MQAPDTAPPATPEAPATHKREHFSVSQLNMYIRCSMQYYFRYILGWIERPKLILANGRAGHTAVELNHRRKISAKEDLPLEQVLDVFSTAYDRETSDFTAGDLQPGEDLGQTKDSTIQTLTVWRMAHAPADRPIAVELPFEIEVPPSEAMPDPVKPIVGRIDALDEKGILDNKFVFRNKNIAEVNSSDQLTLYDAALQQKGVVVPRVGLRTFKAPTSKSVPEIQTLWRDNRLMHGDVRQNRIERAYFKIRTLSNAIKAGIFMPTDDPKVCGSCGFRDRCQMSLVKTDYEAMLLRQKESQ